MTVGRQSWWPNSRRLGYTALHRAATRGDTDVVKVLLKVRGPLAS
jgi:ankyrin repeat protein